MPDQLNPDTTQQAPQPVPTAPMSDPLSTLRSFVQSKFDPSHKVYQWAHQPLPPQTNAFGQSLPLSENNDYVGMGVQGILGTLGLGDNKNKSNLAGQAVSAGIPFLPGGKFKVLPQVMEDVQAAKPMGKAAKDVALGIPMRRIPQVHDIRMQELLNKLGGTGK